MERWGELDLAGFLGVRSLCDAEIWLALLSWYSFYGRSNVDSCSAAGDVEQQLEGSYRLVYQ